MSRGSYVEPISLLDAYKNVKNAKVTNSFNVNEAHENITASRI